MEDRQPIQEVVVTNVKFGWEADTSSTFLLVSSLRQLQIFVSFLSELCSASEYFRPYVQRGCHVVIQCYVGAFWYHCGWFRWGTRKGQAEGGQFDGPINLYVISVR